MLKLVAIISIYILISLRKVHQSSSKSVYDTALLKRLRLNWFLPLSACEKLDTGKNFSRDASWTLDHTVSLHTRTGCLTFDLSATKDRFEAAFSRPKLKIDLFEAKDTIVRPGLVLQFVLLEDPILADDSRFTIPLLSYN